MKFPNIAAIRGGRPAISGGLHLLHFIVLAIIQSSCMASKQKSMPHNYPVDPLVNSTILSTRLPRLLFAGVEKSGSTAVADFMQKAGVCFSQTELSEEYKKEVHFFDKLGNYEKGAQFYAGKLE